jgi:uncharacterized surface protein with fasciclin (FAS1) repeats
VKRLFLKAAGAAAAGALLKACGGGGGDGGGSGSPSGSQTLLQLLQDGRFSILLTALQNAGLANALGQAGTQTLFAPTNDAFNALSSRAGALSNEKLAEFVGFHVVPQFYAAAALRALGSNNRPDTLYSFRGDTAKLIFVTENGGPLNIWDGIGRTSITIPEPDIAASNGVLHVVSDVLVPRGVLTVLQILRASIDSFSEFSASVTGSTADTLNGPGPFTVFVPGNDVVDGSLNALQHIVRGEFGSNTFATSPVMTTLAGRRVTLREGGTDLATLNYGSNDPRANVTDVDFFGTNGVVNVIDRVLT